jgi:hypothetical protein
MDEPEPQSFENHAKLVPLYHVGVFGALVLNLFWALYKVVVAHNPDSFVGLLVALALIGLFFYARIFALTVQDRVIRLEMSLRLREVLPADLRDRIEEIRPGQLIALRFASDAELPELVRDILGGTLRDRTEIKRRIRNWQPDHLRA